MNLLKRLIHRQRGSFDVVREIFGMKKNVGGGEGTF
jgi:hypothetical protein